MTSREKRIDLIRKCLALTSSPFPGEVSAARLKAEQLMQKHGITEADLALPAPQPQQPQYPVCPNCGGVHPQQRRRSGFRAYRQTVSSTSNSDDFVVESIYVRFG